MLLVATACVTACTDGASPTSTGGSMHLAIVPQFHLTSSDNPLSLQRARVVIVDAENHDTIAGPFIKNLDPSAPTWSLPVAFDVPRGHENGVAFVELMHVEGDDATTQWAGMTDRVALSTAESTPVSVDINMYPGPSANLEVESLRIDSVPARVMEGDSVRMRAVAQGATGARVFWRVSDTDVATIDDNGMLRSRRDGSIYVRADAGPKCDSIRLAIRARPFSIRIVPDTVRTSSIGDPITFSAVTLDARGQPVSDDTLDWSSADENVAAHLPTPGMFAAGVDGTVKISARSHSTPSVQAFAVVVMKQVAVDVALSESSFDFDSPGEQHKFNATPHDARGHAMSSPVTWSSSNQAVARVDAGGIVTSVGEGTAEIRAVVADGPSAVAAIHVRPRVARPPVSVSVSPPTASIERGRTVQLRADVANDTTGPSSGVVWTTSDSAIATVDARGLVFGVNSGDAVITATSQFDHTKLARATITVTVPAVPVDTTHTPVDTVPTPVDTTPAPPPPPTHHATRVAISPDSIIADVAGASMSFHATVFDETGTAMSDVTLSWSSSNEAVVSSSGDGMFVAHSNGTATILAMLAGTTSADALTGTARAIVRIPRPPVAVTVSPVAATVTAGQTTRLSATVANDSTGALSGVTWTTSDATVATVDSTGVVRGVAAGIATITATSRLDGSKNATSVVTVLQPVTLTMTPASSTLTIGDTLMLSSNLGGPLAVVSAGVVYSSSNPTVATVNPLTGQVIALLAGSATITAKAVGDSTKTATSAITVIPPAVVITTVTTDKGGPLVLTAVKGPILVTALVTAVVNPIKTVETGIDSNVECTSNFSPNITNGQGAATVTCKIRTEAKSNGVFVYPNGPHTIFVRAIDTNGVASTARLTIVTNN